MPHVLYAQGLERVSCELAGRAAPAPRRIRERQAARVGVQGLGDLCHEDRSIIAGLDLEPQLPVLRPHAYDLL